MNVGEPVTEETDSEMDMEMEEGIDGDLVTNRQEL
jgi:hypothetical protein